MLKISQNDVIVQKGLNSRIFHNFNSSDTILPDHCVCPGMFDDAAFNIIKQDDDGNDVYIVATDDYNDFGSPIQFTNIGFDNPTHNPQMDPTVVYVIDIWKDFFSPSREVLNIFYPTYFVAFPNIDTMTQDNPQGGYLLKCGRDNLVTTVTQRNMMNPWPIAFNRIEAPTDHVYFTYCQKNIRIGLNDVNLWFSPMDYGYKAQRISMTCDVSNWIGT